MAHKSKQEITAIIASILLAFVMWIYAMTDKNPMVPKTVENIPVQLVDTEALEQYGLALTPEQNFTIKLDVKGKALDVYTNAVPENFIVIADLNNAQSLKKGENNIQVEIKGTPNGIQVDNPTGFPYLIKVKLEKLDEKSVPVKIDLKGSVKEGYGYLNAITKPTEVLVRGPESIVNSVYSITGQIELNNKSSDINSSIVISPVDKDGKEVKYVSLGIPTVDVSVPVKPAKEVNVVVKTTGNIGGSKILKRINQSMDKVIIIGDKKLLDKINEIETMPYDLSKLKTTFTDTLSLKLPEGINVSQDMSNLNVEFVVENIIEKTIRIPINIVNTRDGYSYSTSAPDVNLTLRGAESLINSLDVNNVSATVDVNNLDAGQQNIDVKINIPEGLSITKTVPDKVSVTITKPEEQATNP